jgi:WSC domain
MGGLNDPSTSCNIKSPIQEVIDGVLDKLPGNNPVTGWGATVAAAAPAAPSPVVSPASSSPAAPASTSPILAASSPSGTTSAASPSSSSTSATNGAASGWKSIGCYSDIRDQRVLSGITFANLGNGKVTSTGCVAYCDSKGFRLAGTEFGGQCFCGNALVNSTLQPDSSCTMKCEGDASQICGGGLTLSVYSKNGIPRRHRRSDARAHAHFAKP